MNRYCVSLLCLFALVGMSFGQCANGQCSAPVYYPSTPVYYPSTPVYYNPIIVEPPISPSVSKDCPCSGQCVCGCNGGGKCKCNPTPAEKPKEKKVEPKAKKMEEKNFGVNRPSADEVRYYRRGKPCTRSEAIAAITSTLSDDSGLLRLTVIGAKEDTQKVVEDFKALSEFKGKVICQSYTPDSWQIKDMGFKTEGKPVIYLQRADGKVLHRQDKYEGADKLAEALRKADPSYDPKKDPNLLDNNTINIPVIISKVPMWVWFAGLVVVYLVLTRKEK